MKNSRIKKSRKRAVTFTAAALFCIFVLFYGFLSVFIKTENRLSKTELSMPILQKTAEGKAKFTFLTYDQAIETEPEFSENPLQNSILYFFPDDSSAVFSFLTMLYEETFVGTAAEPGF